MLFKNIQKRMIDMTNRMLNSNFQVPHTLAGCTQCNPKVCHRNILLIMILTHLHTQHQIKPAVVVNLIYNSVTTISNYV